jgi:hypothetical protein
LKEGFHAAEGKGEHALSRGGRVIWSFFLLVQSLPLQLAQARNSVGNEKYMRAMGRVNHALRVARFLFLLNSGVGERISFHLSFCSEHVHSMFFSSSQWVPIRFATCSPKVFPIGTHLNPIYLAKDIFFSPIGRGQRGGIPSSDIML